MAAVVTDPTSPPCWDGITFSVSGVPAGGMSRESADALSRIVRTAARQMTPKCGPFVGEHCGRRAAKRGFPYAGQVD